MKNPPTPLHSRYPPRKLLLFLLSNTHPAIGVMGNANTVTLHNNTQEVVKISDVLGIITCKSVEPGGQTKIDPREYDGRGGHLPSLMIQVGQTLQKLSDGDYKIAGEQLFSDRLKTVTINQLNDQNSTGVVDYEVKFQLKHDYRELEALPLKLSRDSVLDHDYGWSVQFINEGVKLTRKEGVTMILDPSKLFSGIEDTAITSLLHVVLKFWPRTFADLNRKDDLAQTVRFVNDLMVQAKDYNADRSKGEVAKVMEKVSSLNKLCAAEVDWYGPLFPEMFPPEVGQMAEGDQEKLEKFATAIAKLLQKPKSLPGRSR